MFQLQVLIPGPWWHELTYQTEGDVPAGARVLVPMGRGVRVAAAERFAVGKTPPARAVRVAFCTPPRDQLEKGLRVLGELIAD